MGRRSNSYTRDELRAAVITAVKELVESEGYTGLSVRKIANRLGYTVGALYHVFESLDDVVTHVNAETLEVLYHALEHCQTIEALAKTYLAFSIDNLAQWRLLFERGSGEGDVSPLWYQKKIDLLFLLVEQVLAKEVPSLPTAILSGHARILWASIHGIVTLHQGGKLTISWSETPQAAIALFVKTYLQGMAFFTE